MKPVGPDMKWLGILFPNAHGRSHKLESQLIASLKELTTADSERKATADHMDKFQYFERLWNINIEHVSIVYGADILVYLEDQKISSGHIHTTAVSVILNTCNLYMYQFAPPTDQGYFSRSKSAEKDRESDKTIVYLNSLLKKAMEACDHFHEPPHHQIHEAERRYVLGAIDLIFKALVIAKRKEFVFRAVQNLSRGGPSIRPYFLELSAALGDRQARNLLSTLINLPAPQGLDINLSNRNDVMSLLRF